MTLGEEVAVLREMWWTLIPSAIVFGLWGLDIYSTWRKSRATKENTL